MKRAENETSSLLLVAVGSSLFLSLAEKAEPSLTASYSSGQLGTKVTVNGLASGASHRALALQITAGLSSRLDTPAIPPSTTPQPYPTPPPKVVSSPRFPLLLSSIQGWYPNDLTTSTSQVAPA
jgi:hypothetical protein